MVPAIIAVILYLSLLYVCGRFTANYATQRGRSGVLWFVLGGLFYPFPYIVLALLRPKRQKPQGTHPKFGGSLRKRVAEFLNRDATENRDHSHIKHDPVAASGACRSG